MVVVVFDVSLDPLDQFLGVADSVAADGHRDPRQDPTRPLGVRKNFFCHERGTTLNPRIYLPKPAGSFNRW